MKVKLLFSILLLCFFVRVHAQWVLNFGTAATVQPKNFVFISGTGGQVTYIKNPNTANFTPFLAHAGIRVGVLKNLDIGYRLCTILLPWTAIGPTLGSAIDAKLRLTNNTAPYQIAVIAGGGYAYLKIFDNHKSAWSPGMALSITKQLNKTTSITFNSRLLQTVLPTAIGGKMDNYVNVIGESIGLSGNLNSVIGIMPEIGIFHLTGKINNIESNGIGLQAGIVLKVDFKKTTAVR